MTSKRAISIFFTLILMCGVMAWADDNNHGVDHSKGHSNDTKANCKKPPKPTPPPPAPPPVSTTNNNNTNNNTLNNTNNLSQNQSQSQSQSATATSNASVSNSGNSSSSSAASNNGNGNGNGSNNTTFQAPKIPVSTAYAPPVVPTANCFKGVGAGVQTGVFGGSFGGGKIDENCRALETARNAPNRLTFCKIYIKLKDSKAAGVTLEDCMGQDPQPEASVPPPPPSPVQIILPSNTSIATTVPTPILPQPSEHKPEITVVPDQLLGICTFAKAVSCKPENGPAVITVSSICKQMLEQAKRSLIANPNSVLLIRGNRNPSEDRLTATARANNVKKQLEAYGVSSSRLKVEVGTGTARTVELVLVPQS